MVLDHNSNGWSKKGVQAKIDYYLKLIGIIEHISELSVSSLDNKMDIFGNYLVQSTETLCIFSGPQQPEHWAAIPWIWISYSSFGNTTKTKWNNIYEYAKCLHKIETSNNLNKCRGKIKYSFEY